MNHKRFVSEDDPMYGHVEYYEDLFNSKGEQYGVLTKWVGTIDNISIQGWYNNKKPKESIINKGGTVILPPEISKDVKSNNGL